MQPSYDIYIIALLCHESR